MASAFATYYLCLTHHQLSELIVDGYLKQSQLGEDGYDAYDKEMDIWMMQQMRKRLPLAAFGPDDTMNASHFMFVSKDDMVKEWIDAGNYTVIKVKLPVDNVVHFDDNDYIHVINDLAYKSMYLANSESEANAMQSVSCKEVEASWERMFDPSRPRDSTYCGPVYLRAMTPYISKDMVQGVVAL